MQNIGYLKFIVPHYKNHLVRLNLPRTYALQTLLNMNKKNADVHTPKGKVTIKNFTPSRLFSIIPNDYEVLPEPNKSDSDKKEYRYEYFMNAFDFAVNFIKYLIFF